MRMLGVDRRAGMRIGTLSRGVCGGCLPPQSHTRCRHQCHQRHKRNPKTSRPQSSADEKSSHGHTAAATVGFLVAHLCLFDSTAYAMIDEHGKYVPTPIDGPGWEIWFGSIVGVIPFIIASYEFGKRISTQRRCSVCGGKGLVKKGKYWKKCTQCGGMLPWLGWRAFWLSNLRPGNGGPLMRPKPADNTSQDDVSS